jgi:oligopeptidase B
MHRIFIRNIATGAVTDTGIKDAASDLVFSADSQWLFYIRVDPATVRSHQLWRHAIGKPGVPDQLLYEETDPTFDLQLARSKSGKFVLLNISQQQSSEVRYLRSDLPLEPLRILERRRTGVVYDADHIADTFYIRTNLDAPDFRVMRAPQDAPQAANWTELIGETPGRLLADIELFESFIALVEEANANQSIKVFRFSDRRLLPVPVPDSVGVMELTLANGNRNTAATMLRVRFSSPNHPEAIYDFDTQNEAMVLRKHSPAWTWFDPAIYTVERVSIAAADGESIPVTLTYRKDRRRAGGNPVLITGYGAYGSSESPGFTESWASLIDRGFVLAQAHVRGGQEKGVRWYDQGRMLNKPNSFNDFIAATEALIERGYADPRRVFARGGSAGGLLVAVAAERRPDLYAGVVAEVPFVDVVTTMSDPTIPLTTLEYQEWGNPAIKQQYETMMSYSPYDNVTAKALPPMLVTAAFNDSQVGFHEPAKWVARLRAARTDGNELLLLTNMSGGHTGAAGRFGANTVDATIMAWLVARANKPD